jgi:hypothetical protein
MKIPTAGELILLQTFFFEAEAKVILNIPLYPLLPHDRLIWRGTSSGVFTVRSAYHLGKELLDNIGGQSSTVRKDTDGWRLIWAMDVPHTIKNFTWRACNNLLPTRENLLKRRVTKDAICPCCLLEDESICHALWSCPAARDVWWGGSSPFQKCVWEGSKFMQLFEYCSQHFKKEDLELMAVTARKIWIRRNAMVFEGNFFQPNVVFSATVNTLAEFKQYNQKEEDPNQSMALVPTRGNLTWQPPPRGTVKVNWDAALNKSSSWIGLGIAPGTTWGGVWELDVSRGQCRWNQRRLKY